MFLFGIRRDSSRDQPHACASRPTVSLSVSSISSPDDLPHSPVLPHSSHLSSLFAVPSGTLVQPCYTLLSLLVARPASASSSRSLFLFLSLSLSFCPSVASLVSYSARLRCLVDVDNDDDADDDNEHVDLRACFF